MEKAEIESCLSSEFRNDQFSSDPSTIHSYSASINGLTCEPALIFYPESSEDVIKIVRIARDNRLTLFPISRGRNLGYGDAMGTQPGQVIVDLRRMNQILAADKMLSTVRIQPGVSQQELYQYIIRNNLPFQPDVTGAGLDASVVGNILERGFGHTDYGDRFSRLIALTAILADGRVYKSGMSSYESDASHVYRYGLGPMLEGLFSQSNFGIITEITLEMMPVPERTEMFVLSTKNRNDLGAMVNAVRELKLLGIVYSAIHIANKSRAVGKKDNRFVGEWNLSGCLYGPSGVVAAKRKIVKRTFRKYLKKYSLWFVGKKLLQLIKFINEKIIKMEVYGPLRDVYHLQTGVPTDEPLKTLMNDATLDSAKLSVSKYDTCFGWINAVVSANGDSATKAVQLLSDSFKKAGYEFSVTLTSVNPRVLILISNVTYTRDPAEIKKAQTFLTQCNDLLNQNGFLPYRAGSGMYEKLPETDKVTEDILRKLKGIFDPDNILAPGRYNIPSN
jgi:4-cresol dehydrogenase (hydroxylating) flavoprotein subunit